MDKRDFFGVSEQELAENMARDFSEDVIRRSIESMKDEKVTSAMDIEEHERLLRIMRLALDIKTDDEPEYDDTQAGYTDEQLQAIADSCPSNPLVEKDPEGLATPLKLEDITDYRI
jgi:hypothetical protein